MQPKKIALLVRTAIEDKKAVDPVILDIAKLTSIAHYFVIAHGNSDVHVKAMAHHVLATLKQKKILRLHEEGLESGRWVVLDYGSVLVHLFHRDLRDFYGLERLWGEAKVVE